MSPERLLLAADAVARGNGYRALEHLQQVQAVDEPQTWLLRGQALGLIGEHAQAEEACRRGIAIDPTNTALRIELAVAFEAQSLFPQAESALLSVLNEHPEHLQALVAYGWLLAKSGDAEGAHHVLDRIDPRLRSASPNLMALQGYLALIEGRQADAAAFIERGLQMDPEASGFRMLRATQAAMQGQTGAAATHLDAAARLDPARAAHEGRVARYLSHPLMAPSRVVDRIGPGALWIAWLVILFGLPRVWAGAPMGWIVGIYLIFAAWTWIVPRLLRRWMIRKGQL